MSRVHNREGDLHHVFMWVGGGGGVHSQVVKTTVSHISSPSRAISEIFVLRFIP